MTTQPTDAYMGQFLRNPQERKININTFINGFSAPRYAFGMTAVVTQEKKFPDVSFYQKAINYILMRSMTDTIIIREGQNEWIDEQFITNMREAKNKGIKRGIYRFYDGRVSPVRQAENLVRNVGIDLPEMEIWIDWEHNYGGAYEGLKNVVVMMKRIEELLLSAKVGMYTGYYFFIQNSNAITNAAEYAYLKNKPLWLAWYTNDASIVKIPAPWTNLLLWQFGTPTVGYEYGCGTLNLDMNYFNGTQAEFNERYGVMPQPPIGETMSYKGTVVKTVRIRNADNTDAGGLLYAGDVVYGEVKLSYGLNRIFYNRIYRKDGTVKPWVGNSALIDGGVTLITTQAGFTDPAEVVTPPPAPTKPVSVTVTLDGYKPLTLSGEMEQV